MGFCNEIIEDTLSYDEYITCIDPDEETMDSDVETSVSQEDALICDEDTPSCSDEETTDSDELTTDSDEETTDSDEETADSEEDSCSNEKEEEEEETLDSDEGYTTCAEKEATNSHERTRDSRENSIPINENEVVAEIISKIPAKNQIMFEIFTRLPPKSIFKFKCVSKDFSKLTSEPVFAAKHSQRPASANTLTGFFYQRNVIPHFMFTWRRDFIDGETDCGEPEFISIDSEADCLPDPSLKFLKQEGRNDLVEIIDSCNGLLLCSNRTFVSLVTTCYVCNPLTKQRVALPHPRKRSTGVYYALLAESTRTGYLRYEVVCLYRPKRGDPCSKLLILSSETGKWEEFEKTLPPLSHESLMGSKVFFNGALFWDCIEGYILVCHSKKSKRSLELIEAPRAPLGRCLWKFGNKLLCYSQGYQDEFLAWSLCFDGDKPLEWKLEGCEEFETLTEVVSREYHELQEIAQKPLPRVRFKIIAYNPGLRKVYLWIPDEIFSYQFAERRLEWVCGYRSSKYNTRDRVMPFVHSLAPLLIGVPEQKPESKVEEEKEKRSDDLMASDETVGLMSFYTVTANNIRPRKAKRR